MKFPLLIKIKMIKIFPADVVFILLINVKMSTIYFGILIFMSRINFMLSIVEHEETSFITSGPVSL